MSSGRTGRKLQPRVGTMFGKYKLVSLVGEGGQGSVYEAYDTDKGRTVALKVLAEQYSQDARFRERFKRESRAAAKLQEPHVIPIHDWGEIDGNLFIDMRMVDGETLHQLLQKGPVQTDRAVHIIAQIASALDAAHAQGLIHRDIKPQNIIVTSQGFAYLLDFGIAEARGETRLTMAGSLNGTFQYMAPERFSDQDSGPAVDIYSLACVLHESLTGKPPFVATSIEGLMRAHLTTQPPQPSLLNSVLGPAFDAVVARGMAKNPDDRYGSAGALARAAGRALQGESQLETGPFPQVLPTGPQPTLSGPVLPSSGPYVYAQPSRGQPSWVLPVVIAVAAALLLGAAGVVIGMLANSDSTRQEGGVASSYPAPTNIPSPTPRAPSPTRVPAESLPANARICPSAYSDREFPNSYIGTSMTSCPFAEQVRRAYTEQSVRNSMVTIQAVSPVTGRRYVMDCTGSRIVTCTGGNDAVVYLS